MLNPNKLHHKYVHVGFVNFTSDAPPAQDIMLLKKGVTVGEALKAAFDPLPEGMLTIDFADVDFDHVLEDMDEIVIL